LDIDNDHICTVTIPDPDWNGEETITFNATDPGGLWDIDNATFNVTAVNDHPIANDDSYGTDEDIMLHADVPGVLHNDTDIDGPDALTTILENDVNNGTLTLNSNGSFSYFPELNWKGIESFTYHAFDGLNNSNTASVTITVNPINDQPTLTDISNQTIDEGETFTLINLDDYVTDIEDPDENITWTYIGNNELQINIINRTANITTPYLDWNGQETITFIATDAGELNATDNATFTVNPINDPPVAYNDSYNTNEDTTLDIDSLGVLNNDTDTENDLLTAALIDNVTNGTLTLNTNGSFEYTPNPDWNGFDTFTYKANDTKANSNIATVTIIVNSLNDQPVTQDDFYDTFEDATLAVGMPGILENDTDFDGPDALSVVLDADVTYGFLSLISNGSFEYIPNPDWAGIDTFTYHAFDGLNGSNVTTVTITVNPVNDPPIVEDIPDQAILEGGGFTVFDLDDYVEDVDHIDSLLTWTYTGNAVILVDIDNDHVCTVTPPSIDWNGEETITFNVTDPQGLWKTDNATFNVTAENDPPTAYNDSYTTDEDTSLNIDTPGILENDIDIDGPLDLITILNNNVTHGTLTINTNGSFHYTPDENWNGIDTFTYHTFDGLNESNNATVTIIINPINDPPVAYNDSYNTNEDTTLNVASPGVLHNDTDIDGPDALTTILENDVNNGTLTLNSNGSFVYIPDLNYNGHDNFTYWAYDGENYSNVATVTITINPINDPPIAHNNTYNTDEDTTLSIASPGILENDIDTENGTLTTILINNVTNGTLGLNTNGSFNYTPNANWYGTDTFTYRAYDGLNESNNATVTITVQPVDDPPFVDDIPDQFIVEGDSFTPIVLDNYVEDPDDPDEGMFWTYNGNAELTVDITDRVATITPIDPNWNGEETITFNVSDPMGLWDVDEAVFNVTAENDPPVIDDIPDQSILEGETFAVINLDEYVEDPDNPDEGMFWTYNGNAELTVDITDRVATITTPDINWFGEETIIFNATDPFGLGDEDDVVFNVTSVNDPPVISDISDQTRLEGESFAVFDLDDFVEDSDDQDEDLSWTYTGNIELIIDINADHTITITIPNLDWNGEETITFNATDPGGLWDIDNATFNVTSVNDPPVANDDSYSTDEDTVLNVPEPGVLVNDTDVDDPLDLTTVLNDNVDHGALNLNSNGSFEYIPWTDWYGTDTFTYQAFDGINNSNIATVTITINPINDPPIIDDIPNQVILEGDSFTTFDLDDYVEDVDHLDSELTWTNSSNVELLVDIDIDHVVTITTPNPDWNGEETITFNVTDPLGLWDIDNVIFIVTPVNDPPVVSDIPDQIIQEGVGFTLINLDDYVNDVEDTDENITWTFTGNNEIQVNITNRTANITTPHPDWNGQETITFRATDTGGLNATDNATFTVNDPPNAPHLISPPLGTTVVSTSSATLKVRVSDPDEDVMSVSFYDGSNDNRLIEVTDVDSGEIASFSWDGRTSGTIYQWYVRVSDSLGENQSETWWFTTKSSDENPPYIPPDESKEDPPQNQLPIANISGGPFYGVANSGIIFNGSLSYDPDGDIISWYWEFGDGASGHGETITHTYFSSGTYTITLRVRDNEGATDETTATAVISIPNRPPLQPVIDGPSEGNAHTNYTYTFISSDPENDTIRYIFDWGDNSITTSLFFNNSTGNVTSHSWNVAGIYRIIAYAQDEHNATSALTELIVLIDVHYCGSIGYLIDSNSNGTYDLFSSNETRIVTSVEKQSNGRYLIDSNGDGEKDYEYDAESEILTPFEKEEEEMQSEGFPWLLAALIIIIIVIIALIVVFKKILIIEIEY